MFKGIRAFAVSLFGCGLLTAPAFAQSWQWEHPGFHGGDGMLNVSILTRTGNDWAFNNWKAECSGKAAHGGDPVGTELLQGVSVGLYDHFGLFGITAYSYANAILCTNSDQMNGEGWTVNKFHYVTLDISNQNDQRGSWQMFGDWAPNEYKGECPDGYAVTGLAQTPSSQSHGTKVLCSKITLPSPTACWTTSSDEFGLSVGNTYDDYTLTGQDWNYGFIKRSCWADTYVAGVSFDASDRTPMRLLCCQ